MRAVIPLSENELISRYDQYLDGLERAFQFDTAYITMSEALKKLAAQVYWKGFDKWINDGGPDGTTFDRESESFYGMPECERNYHG